MKLPTRYLPAKIRSAVRFFFVGTTGAVLQTWFFMAALTVMGEPDKGTVLYYIAFGIGYILEMIPNYFFSNWYTFNTKPSKKNAGGFLFARAINLVVQFGLLPLALAAFPSWRDGLISLFVIFIGGCINYLICSLFFKKKEETQNPQ
ncbi:MAG: GtrA family protein [Paludibacteraceae bacterium]|nr:GtrA family protein [Bacteroidales bacterium]MDD5989704.1 GtrA family protein [Paludibacteraceae bacterium]MDD6746724.1 GtrA family protein [Paludibacteraceae bacterium]MDY5651411.1 GtrA family protein [Paludibacteraceae bacterium]